jgi:subtilisin family serine protease
MRFFQRLLAISGFMILSACQTPLGLASPGLIPMTLQSKRQWRHSDELPLHWNVQQIHPIGGVGRVPVVVAVLDTGLDHRHPALQEGVYPTIDMVGQDRHRVGSETYDFTGLDGNGHGTHVAGIVRAVVGRSPVRVLPIKVIPASGMGNDALLTAGIERALAWRDPYDSRLRVRILNLSLASPMVSERLVRVIRRADEAGVLVVGASGNEGGAVAFPGSMPEVLTVGGTGYSGHWVSYSSFGESVDLVAPAGDEWQPVLSAWPLHVTTTDFEGGIVSAGLWAGLVGTSMAAPHVSGAAAVLWSGFPDLSSGQLRARLLAMTDPLGGLGRDPRTGFGRLNLSRAWHVVGHDAR